MPAVAHAASPASQFASIVPDSSARGPVVVATDGLEASDAAFHVAAAIADQSQIGVEVISVFEPVVTADVQFVAMPVLPPGWYEEQQKARLDAAHAQRERTLGARCHWPVRQLDGEIAGAILADVEASDAQLVVMGRGRHGLIDRWLGGETVMRLLRGGTVPVLAVEPTQRGLFQRAVIATDFSPHSVHAARVATRLLAPNATLTLVHVKPRLSVRGPEFEEWRRLYERTLPAAFDAVRAALSIPPTITVDQLTLEGEPGRTVSEFARAMQADLVVSATHGYGFLHRLVVGSVATELLRTAPCSFLCVPGTALARASVRTQLAARFRTERLERADWSDALNLLSDTEGGRAASLEVEVVPLGAQIVASHVPFVGAALDSDPPQIQLMFGATRARGQHLTHLIDRVEAIDLLRDATDRPRVVRFTHPEGQTLLQFDE
jgi:nucleotide-binding universal stress UspA family protein